MLSLLVRLLKNSNLAFLAAFLLGIFLGGPASSLKAAILPALVLVMTLSTTQITLSEITHFKNYLRDILLVFGINYIFLSGLILLANWLLVKDDDLYVGFVVMAAIPPAVAVLPFTYLLRGEMMVSLIGAASLYLLALVVAPFISLQFLDVAKIDPLKLFSVLIQLIFIPFVASRLLLKWGLFHRVKGNLNILMNLGFFIVIYIVIGINRSAFLSHFEILLLVSSIAFLRTFVSGHLVDFLSRLMRVDRQRRMSYVLFGSFKNLGAAASIAIVLFNERAAIPSAVTIPFELIFFVWFNYFQRRWG
ncbi:MAG: bile acid:sodium symporter family protein [Thermodesulfobacteriota bacterium]